MPDMTSTKKEVNEKLTKVLNLLSDVDTVLTMEAIQFGDKNCENISTSINAIWIEVNEQLIEFNEGY